MLLCAVPLRGGSNAITSIETTRVHHAARRRGRGVAVRSTCPAAGDAADWIPSQHVASLNRPGGNVTGVSFLTALLAAKRLELLHQFVPKVTTIAHLVNPNIPNTEADRREVQAAAQAVGQQLLVLDVNSERQIETAF